MQYFDTTFTFVRVGFLNCHIWRYILDKSAYAVEIKTHPTIFDIKIVVL